MQGDARGKYQQLPAKIAGEAEPAYTKEFPRTPVQPLNAKKYIQIPGMLHPPVALSGLDALMASLMPRSSSLSEMVASLSPWWLAVLKAHSSAAWLLGTIYHRHVNCLRKPSIAYRCSWQMARTRHSLGATRGPCISFGCLQILGLPSLSCRHPVEAWWPSELDRRVGMNKRMPSCTKFIFLSEPFK